MTNTNQSKEEEIRDKLRNKFTKFYWMETLEQDGTVNFDLIDGSEELSVIPVKNGKMQIEVGEFRDIINYIVDYHLSKLKEAEERGRREVVEKLKEIERIYLKKICTPLTWSMPKNLEKKILPSTEYIIIRAIAQQIVVGRHTTSSVKISRTQD